MFTPRPEQHLTDVTVPGYTYVHTVPTRTLPTAPTLPYSMSLAWTPTDV